MRGHLWIIISSAWFWFKRNAPIKNLSNSWWYWIEFAFRKNQRMFHCWRKCEIAEEFLLHLVFVLWVVTFAYNTWIDLLKTSTFLCSQFLWISHWTDCSPQVGPHMAPEKSRAQEVHISRPHYELLTQRKSLQRYKCQELDHQVATYAFCHAVIRLCKITPGSIWSSSGQNQRKGNSIW